jgi:hypothetical protein
MGQCGRLGRINVEEICRSICFRVYGRCLYLGSTLELVEFSS